MVSRTERYRGATEPGEVFRLLLTGFLNQRLADMIDLLNQIRYAQWNVKGDEFKQVHQLFNGIAERINQARDLIAERIVSLGGTARGTIRQAARGSAIGEYAFNAENGTQHARVLVNQMTAVNAYIRRDIGRCVELGDPITSELFTDISRSLDKELWFLRSHIQNNSWGYHKIILELCLIPVINQINFWVYLCVIYLAVGRYIDPPLFWISAN